MKSAALSSAALLLLVNLAAASAANAQEGSKPKTADQPRSAGETSGPMKEADKDMSAVLQKLQTLGAKPIQTLSPDQARSQPTPADAVKAVVSERGKPMPPPKVTKANRTYPTAGGTQPIRIYTPQTAETSGPFPVIVYYHGGGWVIADLDTYDASAIALATKTPAIVASVEYRHAPEHKFPAAHQDAFAAYQWVLKNAKSFNGDPTRVAVAGESAGGNLAANVAIMARDRNIQEPVHALLVYPVAGTDMTTPSYKENAQAQPLSKAGMEWFVKHALDEPSDKDSPLLNLVNVNLKGLPPTTVITAQIDPLRSEGKTLADNLKQAGVTTTYKNYDGVTHEFFGMDAVLTEAADAQKLAASELSKSFKKQMTAAEE